MPELIVDFNTPDADLLATEEFSFVQRRFAVHLRQSSVVIRLDSEIFDSMAEIEILAEAGEWVREWFNSLPGLPAKNRIASLVIDYHLCVVGVERFEQARPTIRSVVCVLLGYRAFYREAARIAIADAEYAAAHPDDD